MLASLATQDNLLDGRRGGRFTRLGHCREHAWPCENRKELPEQRKRSLGYRDASIVWISGFDRCGNS
jgi:hypothetical protein